MNEIINLLLKLSQEILDIKSDMKSQQKSRLEIFDEYWIDDSHLMQTLNINKKLLQLLRENRIIPFSQLNGKFYYKLTDLENILEKNYLSILNKSHGNN